jgi:anti-anti-sigma factor
LAVIDLRGEIDAQAEEALNNAYSQARANGAEAVLLNFTDVNYIDSTGIALIVGLLMQSRKTKHKLMIYGLNEHYREIFEVTRLSDFMVMVADENAALRA